jgi:rfaE bifunctional protein nucleotidyltransferase chain/domain
MTKVFVNGSFDLLHTGHLSLLEFAKSNGTHLHVALDTDRRIAEKKGPDRPINNQLNRVKLMSCLKFVDSVSVFDTDEELEETIRKYSPDIMIVGSDWKNKKVIGSEYSESLLFFDRVNNESTTETIESYINRRHVHR